MEKVNWLNEKLLQKTFFFWHGRAMKSLGKLNRAFPFLPPKNWWISFQWARGWNIQTLTGVLFCDTDTKEPCKLWHNTECCFHYKPLKNWSISFDLVKRVQISHFITFFCTKRKLVEPKNHHRSFILWHWRTMQTLG